VIAILIATAWLIVVFFALTMCRLAARSDDSQAFALAERIAMSYLAAHKAVPADRPAEQRSPDPQRAVYRATG
jgi:hypothetical protein